MIVYVATIYQSLVPSQIPFKRIEIVSNDQFNFIARSLVDWRGTCSRSSSKSESFASIDLPGRHCQQIPNKSNWLLILDF